MPEHWMSCEPPTNDDAIGALILDTESYVRFYQAGQLDRFGEGRIERKCRNGIVVSYTAHWLHFERCGEKIRPIRPSLA